MQAVRDALHALADRGTGIGEIADEHAHHLLTGPGLHRERAERALDSFATGWIAMRTEACEATRVRRRQSDHDLGLRMACLDRRTPGWRILRAVIGRAQRWMPKRIAADASLPGYRVAMNVGREGGQVVFHVHLHVLGGRPLAGALG